MNIEHSWTTSKKFVSSIPLTRLSAQLKSHNNLRNTLSAMQELKTILWYFVYNWNIFPVTFYAHAGDSNTSEDYFYAHQQCLLKAYMLGWVRDIFYVPHVKLKVDATRSRSNSVLQLPGQTFRLWCLLACLLAWLIEYVPYFTHSIPLHLYVGR